MRNSLQTLERIKKFELDEQQRILAQKLTQEEALVKELTDLLSEYEREKEFAMQNIGVCDFGAYTDNYLKKSRNLEQKLSEIRQQIEYIRDVMADIFKEQKTYNLIDANRRAEQQKESDIKEQKMLDEIGTNAYIKKHQ